MANVKPIYLNSNGVYAPVDSGDTAVVGNLQISQQTTANGVLSTDGSGNVSSALLSNSNVASNAAIAGTKIDPDFGSQNIDTTGAVTADSFSGDGSALTSLNASELSSGTVPDARFPATLPAISGANLTNLNASNISSGTVPDAAFPATLPASSGANLTNLNASNLSSGTLPDATFPATLPASSGANLTSLNASNLSSGTVPDARFPATLPAVSGQNLTALNASNLDSGTIPDARFPATLPAVNGSLLTNLDANELTSGTVDTARISGNYTGITGVGTITTGVWNGTAISDTYLDTISTAGKVSDSALSANVALLDRNNQSFTGTTPSFTNELGVPTPTVSGSAANKGYVDNAVASAVAGIDYKQESKWYSNISQIPSPPGASVATFLSIINGQSGFYPAQTGKFTAGDYILLICGTSEDGQYVFAGSDTGGAGGTPNWSLSRAADMPSGSNATGAYTFCFNQIVLGQAGITYPVYNTALICTNMSPNNIVGTNALTFVTYGVSEAYTGTAPINVTGTTISLNVGAGLATVGNYLVPSVDGSTIYLNGSNEIALKSLPSSFKINDISTDGSKVTATNLDIVTGGPTSNAVNLHRHASNIFLLANTGSALTTGKAVVWNGTTLSYATNSGSGAVAGLVVSDPNTGTVSVANAGVVVTAGPSGSPSVGDSVYLAPNGALQTYSQIAPGDYVTKVGRYLGTVEGISNCVSVQIQEFGIKP